MISTHRPLANAPMTNHQLTKILHKMPRYRRPACLSQPSYNTIRYRRSSGICVAALLAAGGCTAKGHRWGKNHHPSRRGQLSNYSTRVFDCCLGQHRAVSKKLHKQYHSNGDESLMTFERIESSR